MQEAVGGKSDIRDSVFNQTEAKDPKGPTEDEVRCRMMSFDDGCDENATRDDDGAIRENSNPRAESDSRDEIPGALSLKKIHERPQQRKCTSS